MKQTLKALTIVLIAPIVLSVCFASNQIKSRDMVRQPAIEKVKTYHFNKSLLAQVGRQ